MIKFLNVKKLNKYNLIFGIILGLTVMVFFSCTSNDEGKDKDLASGDQEAEMNVFTEIDFELKEFDFGIMEQGEYVSHRFKFKNVGKSNLYIDKVTADCGCTIIDFSKEAILPGDSSYVEAVFNSAGYHGLQVKKIKVFSNTQTAEDELIISAVVESSE